jgi:hypothetical protein
MNQPEPRRTSETKRAEVLQALKNEDYFIYSDGMSFLEEVGFDPAEFIVGDLIDYLKDGKALYLLPENPAKCQCCLRYEDNLVIYVKLAPKTKSNGCFVCLGFHRHNTGHAPLPE